MQVVSALFKHIAFAGALLCVLPACAAGNNDPDLLGAWKGTGDDAQWVVNFMPNDTYQFRLGDSPTGSRGVYVARDGKFELLEGNQKRKVMFGSYRVEDCKVLVLTMSNGTARMDRRGTVPTGGCGRNKPASASAAESGSVFSSLGKSSIATGTVAAPTAPRQAATPGASPKSAVVPDPAKATAWPKSNVQKPIQQSTTAATTSAQQTTSNATAQGTNVVKSGAAAFWSKTKSLSKSAVEAGGKAAKTVGTKAQEAGKAVAKPFKSSTEQADAASDQASGSATSQGN